MANALQAIRGMNDILPEQSCLWQFAEDSIRAVLESYGFREIRMPIGAPRHGTILIARTDSVGWLRTPP